MGRSAQQAKEAYQRAAAAKRMATSPSQSMPSEDAGPRQKLAGQLLQQQLQLLTVDSQEADSALLAKLLHTCLITVALVAAFNAAAGGVGADLSAQGMIAGTGVHHCQQLLHLLRACQHARSDGYMQSCVAFANSGSPALAAAKLPKVSLQIEQQAFKLLSRHFIALHEQATLLNTPAWTFLCCSWLQRHCS